MENARNRAEWILTARAFFQRVVYRLPQWLRWRLCSFPSGTADGFAWSGPRALVVMVLGFSGVLVSTLLDLPNTMRRTLVVLFAAALLCSGFVALVAWFTVSGASSCWL